MSERVIETQVIELKVRGGPGLVALEAAAAKANTTLDAARKRLDSLKKAIERKGGPPTELQAAADAAKDLADAAKKAGTAARSAAKEEREWTKAIKDTGRAADETTKRIEGLTRSIAATQAALRSAPSRFFSGLRSDAQAALRDVFSVKGAIDGVKSAGRRGLQGAAIGVGAAYAGAVGIAGAGLSEIVGRGSAFAAQRDALAAGVGSRAGADAQIAELRATRGLNVGEGIATANRLRGLGLGADTGNVKALSQIAAGTPGKSSSDVAEALADAATGEFERLKEFNIKAKVEGDKVAATFKGVTTVIDKGGASWQKYLAQIAASDFGNTLELKANTLGGAVDKLQDGITQAASAVYDSGLGDALQEVVADITAFFTTASGPGAKSIGEVLGAAVKDLWARAKELIGPLDELPGKIEGIIRTALDFVGAITTMVGWVVKAAGALGSTGIALTAFGVAATAALGPIGAVVAGGVALGTALSSVAIYAKESAESLLDTTTALERFAAAQAKIEADDKQRIATGQAKEDTDRIRTLNARGAGSDAAADKAASTFRAQALRRMGKSEFSLSDAEKRDLDNKTATVRARTRLAGGIESGSVADAGRFGDAAVAAEERGADAAELGRLRTKAGAKNGPKLTKSEKKRLGELETKYDLATVSKPGKVEKSAYQTEVDAEIKQKSQDAGRVAGLRASRDGKTAKEAEAIALRTEKETTARLQTQVDQGKLLPGQIQQNVLALARVEDVASRGTPPPIAVTNIGPVTVNVPVSVTGNTIDADARQIEIATRRVVKTVMVEETREAIRRVTSGVTV